MTDFFRRPRLDRDLAEEIRQHLDEKTDALVESGMTREDAAAAARRAFGNVTHLEEQGRDVWRLPPIEDLFADVRFAIRQLRKAPAFALAAILTVALGIGANTTVFSLVNAVILRPLPYPEPDRLVSVHSRDIRGTPRPISLSYPTFFDFRTENAVFEQIVSYRESEFTLTGGDQPIHLRGQIVSADPFSMLHVQPALGRGFLPHEEEAGERVVILSHDVWRTRFAADPSIVGRTLMVDAEPHTVVGVAPPGLEFPLSGEPAQIWTTLARDASSATLTPATKQRGARMLNAMARLKNGVTIEQAQAQMDTIAASLAVRHPDSNKNQPGTYVRHEIDALVSAARGPLYLLLIAVGVVLLIASANIASLLLARTEERMREFVVRSAIGAGRGRIVRQLITESLALAAIGCAVGLLATSWSVGFFRTLPVPRIAHTDIDGRVLAFSVILSVVTSIVFGLAPALRAASTGLVANLKESSRTSTAGSDRLRHGMCVAQVALGLVLVSTAGLLIGSFLHLVRRDLGFRPDGLVTFSLDLPGYAGQKHLEFHASLLDRLQGVPGVTASAVARPLPLTGSQMTIGFNIEERPTPPSERPRANMAIVSPGYFRTIGVPLLEGREFSDRDGATAPGVLIVNRAFADKFFPGQHAVGKRIEPGAISDDRGTRMREIVGIVGNARQSPLKVEDEPIYYFPYHQMPWCCPSIVVRSDIPPDDLQTAIRAAVASLDKQLAVYDVRTADDILARSVAAPRFVSLLLGGFAVIALLLTAVGLYGVLASAVVTRTREIGVRMALGADHRQVVSIVVKRALALVLAGLTIGVVGAFAANRVLIAIVEGLAPANSALIASACVVLAITGAAAAYVPARRAASIDPIQALRTE